MSDILIYHRPKSIVSHDTFKSFVTTNEIPLNLCISLRLPIIYSCARDDELLICLNTVPILLSNN
jgi:hypothetical protein